MTPRTEAAIDFITMPGGMDGETPLFAINSRLIAHIVNIENEAFEAGRLAGRAEAEGKEQTP